MPNKSWRAHADRFPQWLRFARQAHVVFRSHSRMVFAPSNYFNMVSFATRRRSFSYCWKLCHSQRPCISACVTRLGNARSELLIIDVLLKITNDRFLLISHWNSLFFFDFLFKEIYSHWFTIANHRYLLLLQWRSVSPLPFHGNQWSLNERRLFSWFSVKIIELNWFCHWSNRFLWVFDSNIVFIHFLLKLLTFYSVMEIFAFIAYSIKINDLLPVFNHIFDVSWFKIEIIRFYSFCMYNHWFILLH